MGISLDRLPPAEWGGLAGFIVRCNALAHGGVRCLHAARGADEASHAAELMALPIDEAAFWVIREGEAAVGVVGCEFDATLGRAWVRGPLTVRPEVLDAVQHSVPQALESGLPQVREFDAFPSADDDALNAWYAAAGYAPLQLHTVMRARIEGEPAVPAVVGRATEHDLPAVLALHHALFATPYLGEADFRRAVDHPDHALWVARGEDGLPAGYLYVQDEPTEQEAYVDYLGVLPSQRGQGLGRALLAAAACWGAQHGRRHLALTVREDRRPALSLYEQAGFVKISAGRHWRKAVGRAA